jgi:menaquinone-9 beta-reductase
VRRNPLIIGGGPAGSAAAIALAAAGHQPILLERAPGPADKVCGDFLSIDTIRHLRDLGLEPAGLGAARISHIRLVSGTQVVETTLPFPALGLSRRALDAALLRRAEQAGAVVRNSQTVRRVTRGEAAWHIQTDDTTLSAETIFLATGKHDLRDTPRPHSRRDAIGMKMYFALAPGPARALAGATELTLFPGGYAGMQFVENDQAVLCIAVQRQAFQAYGGGWAGLLAAVGQRSPRFSPPLAGSRALRPRPLAVAGIPYGYQASPGSLFRIGDQAAVIPSLTGDGMAIALYSGQQAAKAWLADSGAAAYQRNLARTLAPQMRLASLLHRTGMNGPCQAAAMPIIRLFPGLLRQAARHTRLPVA